jgi:hypothetical protein
VRHNQQGKVGWAILGVVLLAFAFGVYNHLIIHADVAQQTANLDGGQVQIPDSLTELAKQKALGVDDSGQLQLNGQLRLNSGAVLNPSDAPSSPVTGQLYLSRKDNLLYYYNGTQFVSLATNQPATTPVDTAAGGGGELKTGVLSLQGQTGALSLVAGGGIAVNGLKISNSGVTSIKVANGLLVSGLNGDVTITLPQNIGTGATPTFQGLVLLTPLGVGYGGTGSNSATGARSNLGAAASGANSDITSITGLTTALSVGQGGTGTNQFPAGSVLVGNDFGAITFVSSAGPNKCLLSTNSAPVFADCPGSVGGSVTAGTQSSGKLVKWGSANQVTDSLLGDNGSKVFSYGDFIAQPTSASATAFVIQDQSANKLLTADTLNWKVSVVNLVVSGHFMTSGTAPTVASNGSSGTVCSTISGNDITGRITVTVGAGASAGQACVINFNQSFASVPHIVISGNSSTSANMAPYAKALDPNSFEVGVGAASPPAGSFTFEYFIAQ